MIDINLLKLVRRFDDLFSSNSTIPKPRGLVFLPTTQTIFTIDNGSSEENTEFQAISLFEEELNQDSSTLISNQIKKANNVVFDSKTNSFLVLKSKRLLQIGIKDDGSPDPNQVTRWDIDKWGIKAPQALTIDQNTGVLFVLSRTGITRIERNNDSNFKNVTSSQLDLESTGLDTQELTDIAFNPSTNNLYVLNSTEQKLYEINQTGNLVAESDLSPLGFKQLESIEFAPSGDQTDNPEQLSLYIADSDPESGGITELSFVEPVAVTARTAITANATANATPTLIQTIDISSLNPPSPDPAGITYLDSSGTLLISDSEVNEIPSLFTGDNLFEVTLSGSLNSTGSTVSYSEEPTGLDFNPANGHLFVSDDDEDKIFIIDPGVDGNYGSADDILVSSFSTRDFGSFDPEGVAFASTLNALFIADGVNAEFYRIDPGTNGIFDGVDDVVTSFDTDSLGLSDPEGIAFNSGNGNLYGVGEPDDSLFEITTDGNLVQIWDISGANAVNASGLTFAPGSQNSEETNIYITDRGVDNDSDPNENDGKIYEFFLGLVNQNQPPVVDAGLGQTVVGNSVFLDASISDDGLPDPPGTITTSWVQLNGPTGGTATFDDPNAVDTNVTFSEFGTYTLQLTADDGEFSISDEVIITTQEQAPDGRIIYVSSTSSGNIDGISFKDEDILTYDTNTDTWSMYFDGSDVGVGAGGGDLYSFHINDDGSILFSTDRDITLPDVGAIEKSDIVRFIPTSTGNNTTGSYELYFDASDVGFSGENIDAIGFTPNGDLIIGSTSSYNVGGVSGGDEDLLLFNATSLGENTSGSWEIYLDGSDVGLNDSSSEDVNGTWIDPNNGDIYLTTKDDFSVVGVSGEGDSIFNFSPISTGPETSGNFSSSSFWDPTANRFSGEIVDGLSVV